MRILTEGREDTRLLMLSATPVAMGFKDLRAEALLMTKGDDAALADTGVPSITAATREAEREFNRAVKDEGGATGVYTPAVRTIAGELILGRSRAHIETHYRTDIERLGDLPSSGPPANFNDAEICRRPGLKYADLVEETLALRLAAYHGAGYARRASDDDAPDCRPLLRHMLLGALGELRRRVGETIERLIRRTKATATWAEAGGQTPRTRPTEPPQRSQRRTRPRPAR